MEDQKLVQYARRFLRKQTPLKSVYPEQAADFAAQLRRGCHQDLLRLIDQITSDTPEYANGKQALQYLKESLIEAEIQTWGLPDCACKKPDCVYCSTGMATTPAAQIAG
jgi:tRNA nucleotidyltransferase/poly(A) polymerase